MFVGVFLIFLYLLVWYQATCIIANNMDQDQTAPQVLYSINIVSSVEE